MKEQIKMKKAEPSGEDYQKWLKQMSVSTFKTYKQWFDKQTQQGIKE